MTARCELSMNGMRGQITSLDETKLLPNEWPHKWDKPIVTYRLNNFTNDWEKKKHQERAVSVAFRTWQERVKDVKFKRVYDSFTPVDIPIDFKPLSAFGGRRGVLADAVYPGQIETSPIRINDDWDWVPHANWQNIGHPPLLAVLIHEIGHALGLKHDTRTMDSIMYPSFDLGVPKNNLHEYDIARIQDKYGKRTVSQRFLDVMKRRRLDGTDFR